MTSNILIMGASGGIGLEAVKAGLDAGHRIRAFSRSANQISVSGDRLEKIAGDALKREDVNRALDGIDVVIQSLGVPANLKMLTGPIDLFSKATRILVPSMQELGVKRLICVTGYGAGDGRSRISPLQRVGFELFLGRAYADKSTQEDIIKKSSLDWTIVRPGVLTSKPATHDYRVLVEPDSWRNGLISRADVADYLIKQVSCNSAVRQTPVLIGKCALPNI